MVLTLSNSYHSCCSVRSLKQQVREEGVPRGCERASWSGGGWGSAGANGVGGGGGWGSAGANGVGVGGVVQELMGWGCVG